MVRIVKELDREVMALYLLDVMATDQSETPGDQQSATTQVRECHEFERFLNPLYVLKE